MKSEEVRLIRHRLARRACEGSDLAQAPFIDTGGRKHRTSRISPPLVRERLKRRQALIVRACARPVAWAESVREEKWFPTMTRSTRSARRGTSECGRPTLRTGFLLSRGRGSLLLSAARSDGGGERQTGGRKRPPPLERKSLRVTSASELWHGRHERNDLESHQEKEACAGACTPPGLHDPKRPSAFSRRLFRSSYEVMAGDGPLVSSHGIRHVLLWMLRQGNI